MKKMIAAILVVAFVMSLTLGTAMAYTSGDENYNDNSQEFSTGPGVPPDDGMARDEPRTRNKDAIASFNLAM